jgi:predicted nuclease of predicted toxin-antitoxin system
VRLLLDENLSPSIVRRLVEAGHDVWHVRDRGLAGAPDHVVWRRAIDEARVLITINERDFVKLAGREELHGGLVTLPFGTTRDEQFALIMQASAALGAQRGSGLNAWLRIDLDGAIEIVELSTLR